MLVNGDALPGGLEPPLLFLWKKPRMELWLRSVWEADDGFLKLEPRGVDISLPSIPRTILVR